MKKKKVTVSALTNINDVPKTIEKFINNGYKFVTWLPFATGMFTLVFEKKSTKTS
jgi:hypothetical protein